MSIFVCMDRLYRYMSPAFYMIDAMNHVCVGVIDAYGVMHYKSPDMLLCIYQSPDQRILYAGI